jgi:hypothetical protein
MVLSPSPRLLPVPLPLLLCLSSPPPPQQTFSPAKFLPLLTRASYRILTHFSRAATQHPTDGDSKYLWNVDQFLPHYTAATYHKTAS